MVTNCGIGTLVPLLLILFFAVPSFAATPVLTAAQEARAEAVGNQLRCVVCQNESVEESRATLAANMRQIIREQIAAGRSDHQIMQWMTARYGDFIRLDPPFKPLTFLLWGIPIIAPLAGLGIAYGAHRRRRPPPAPLTEAEKSRLASLLE